MYSTDPIADQAHSILDWKGARATRQFLEAQSESVVNASAEMLALLAEEAHESGDEAKAQELVGRALSLDPNDPTSLAVCAMVECRRHRKAGTPELARDNWERALAVPHTSWLAYLNAPASFVSIRKEDRAIDVAQSAALHYPDSPHCHLVKAETWGALMRSERGESILRTVYERFPTHHAVACAVAMDAILQVKWSEGIILGAAEQAPDHAGPRASLAYSYLMQARHEEAEAMAEKALAICPNDGVALDALLTITRSKGDKAQAAELMRRMQELNPNSATRLIEDLCINESQKQPLETNQKLQHIERKGGVEARAARMYRLLYLASQSFLDLSKLLDEIERDENRTRYWYVHKGDFVRNRRKPEAAIAIYRAGLERYPQNGRLLVGLIGWLHICDRKAELATELDKLQHEMPGHPLGLVELAQSLGGLRRFRLAKSLLEHGQTEFPHVARFAQVDLALDVVAGKVSTVYRRLKAKDQLSKNLNLVMRAAWFAANPPYGSRD